MKIRNGIIVLSIGLSVIACDNPNSEVKTEVEVPAPKAQLTEAEELVLFSIDAHGGDVFKTSHFSFQFRNKLYTIDNNGSEYKYTRKEKDEKGNLHEETLDNNGYVYFLNNKETALSEEEKEKKVNSLNSVIYFASLPFRLQDPGVQVDYKGQSFIRDTAYQLVTVTFDVSKGGKDYQDEYLYWLNEKTWLVDYLAYNFKENGGGARFRKAINRRKVGGVLIQDYINFEGSPDVELTLLAEQFEKGELKEKSRIELENLKELR